ncbi:hypothetical protein DMB38_27870 [Streptomyces sp. WAC 06738]|uniref:hypothetical protein n=1 Tax=Streptomyces sp. WAC 06738 TaxID=2203210 RepID=UPI000F6F8D67|nr:hypothetical protein [Streptomyces sp. WAC 06738]AZM49097.1 hypothetical protein DMB38_27870 [Streptomyces sp. WAC 06738]
MPLPFLTADRDFGDVAGDAPLPYADRDRWRRPYRPGPWRVLMAAIELLLASYLLFATVIMLLADSVTGALTCAGVAGGIILAALRLLRVGVWVSAHGLRQVHLLRTVTLAWDEVAAVRTVQQPVKWLGLPRTVQGQALLVVPGARRGRGGDSAPLRPLLTDSNADFLSRPEAFDRAADTVEAWATELR